MSREGPGAGKYYFRPLHQARAINLAGQLTMAFKTILGRHNYFNLKVSVASIYDILFLLPSASNYVLNILFSTVFLVRLCMLAAKILS